MFRAAPATSAASGLSTRVANTVAEQGVPSTAVTQTPAYSAPAARSPSKPSAHMTANAVLSSSDTPGRALSASSARSRAAWSWSVSWMGRSWKPSGIIHRTWMSSERTATGAG